MASTIKDVAQRAGVGVATASRALSGSGSVSKASLARVQAAAAALDYRPSAIAQALSLRRSGAIGVFVPELASFFYSSIVTAADQVLRSTGRHLVVVCASPTGDPRQEALDGVDFLLSRECDGLILTGHHLTEDDLHQIRSRVDHLAIINRAVPGLDAACFLPDHLEGGRIAARALLSQGHRQIALLTGPNRAADSVLRVAGFVQELAGHGLRPVQSFPGDFSRECGWECGALLMGQIDRRQPPDQRCTAVFCGNDRMALGLISRLWVEGWRVPDDLSVVGYDNDDFAPFATPPLTTVRIPLTGLAQQATSRLIQWCYGDVMPQQADLAPTLVRRASVGPGPFAPLGPQPACTEAALADQAVASLYPPRT